MENNDLVDLYGLVIRTHISNSKDFLQQLLYSLDKYLEGKDNDLRRNFEDLRLELIELLKFFNRLGVELGLSLRSHRGERTS